jgi:hypothetical protein
MTLVLGLTNIMSCQSREPRLSASYPERKEANVDIEPEAEMEIQVRAKVE